MKISKVDFRENPKNIVRVQWKVTNACNYRCHYCIQKDNHSDFKEGNKLFLKIACEKINQIFQIIKEELPDYEIRFNFFGGEPTLVDLPFILNNLNIGQISTLSMFTNLSNKIDYYKNIINTCKNKCKLQISASFHEDYNNYTTFLDKIESIDTNIVRPCIMLLHDKRYDAISMYKDAINRGLKPILQIERNPDTNEIYTLDTEYQEFLRSVEDCHKPMSMIYYEDGSTKVIECGVLDKYLKNVFDTDVYCNDNLRQLKINEDMSIDSTCHKINMKITDDNFMEYYKNRLRENFTKCLKKSCSYCHDCTIKLENVN